MKTTTALEKKLPALAQIMGVSVSDLLSHCRKAELVDARSMAVALMMSQPGVKQEDVAPVLGISQAGVSYLLIRHNGMMHYDDYKQRFAAVEAAAREARKRARKTKKEDPDQ